MLSDLSLPTILTHSSATQWNICSVGIEIRVEHDAVSGLTRLESGDGVVDTAHRKVFGLRRDTLSRRKPEHRLDGCG
jgi:hypothetical protein